MFHVRHVSAVFPALAHNFYPHSLAFYFSTSSNIFVGGNGGAIRAVGDSKLDIRFSMFRNNEARQGGAVYNNGDAYVVNTSFLDNVAEIKVSVAQ